MGFRDVLSNVKDNVKSIFFTYPSYTDSANVSSENEGQMKAFVSNDFLYKPPFGYPRMVDIPNLRALAKTPYVFMVVSTIVDEVASVDWAIQPKPNFEKDDKELEESGDDLVTFNNQEIPRETL